MKGEQKPSGIFKLIGQHSITWDITIIIVIVVAMVSVASIVINLTLVSRRNEQQFTQKKR